MTAHEDTVLVADQVETPIPGSLLIDATCGHKVHLSPTSLVLWRRGMFARVLCSMCAYAEERLRDDFPAEQMH